jgi:hypothetical protein
MNNDEFTPVEVPQPAANTVEAPYGYKADGTPKLRAGRPSKSEAAPAPEKEKKAAPAPEKKAESKSKASINFEELTKNVEANRRADASPSQQGLPAPESSQIVSLIDGYMLMAMLDAGCPALLKFLLKKQLGSVPQRAMMLKKEQKESLEPLADLVAIEVQKYVNPLVAFTLVVGFSYYNNAMEYLENKK